MFRANIGSFCSGGYFASFPVRTPAADFRINMSGSTSESLIETLKKKLVSFKLTVNALTLEVDHKKKLLKEEEEKRSKVVFRIPTLSCPL